MSRSIILPSGTSLGTLLQQLSPEFGMDLIEATGSGGSAFVVINETHWVVPRDLNRSLQSGDVVLLMPFITDG